MLNIIKGDKVMRIKKSMVVGLIASGLVMSGCTATWNGIKEDSQKGWKVTKEVSQDAWDKTKEVIDSVVED
jgi:hypothetical protein